MGQVSILLSTYNGERFLPELLDSLLSQTYPDVTIEVRDDGSTDRTYEILSRHASNYSNIRLRRGARIGVVQSFFTLLREASPGSEYFSFCDQDDVWLPDKVAAAVETLEKQDVAQPLLYCSCVEYVDTHLNHVGYSKIPLRLGFGNALVENVATGCTTVLNREARRVLLERLPKSALMFDWWCYLVIGAFGKVIYDKESRIRYRQHGQNAIGAPKNGWDLLKSRLVRLMNPDSQSCRIGAQAAEFDSCYGTRLDEDKSRTLSKFLSAKKTVWSRMLYALMMDTWRQSRVDTVLLRTLILMGRF